MNNAIEETLVNIYIEGLSDFTAKMEKNIRPSVETCYQIFASTTNADDKIQEWNNVVGKAKKEAVKTVFEI